MIAKQNGTNANQSAIHPHRGFAHTLSILVAMTSAFFLGLVIISLMFLRGQ